MKAQGKKGNVVDREGLHLGIDGVLRHEMPDLHNFMMHLDERRFHVVSDLEAHGDHGKVRHACRIDVFDAFQSPDGALDHLGDLAFYFAGSDPGAGIITSIIGTEI